MKREDTDTYMSNSSSSSSNSSNSSSISSISSISSNSSSSSSSSIDLYLAVSNGHHEMLGSLLENTNRENLRKLIDTRGTWNGKTALHIAASIGCRVSVSLLLSYGADREIKDHRGRKALELATDRGVKALLECADKYSRLASSSNTSAPVLRACMLNSPLSDFVPATYARDPHGFSALQLAVLMNQSGNVEAIAELRISRLRKFWPSYCSRFNQTRFVQYFQQIQRNLLYIESAACPIESRNLQTLLAQIISCASSVVEMAERQLVTNYKGSHVPVNPLDIVREVLEVLQQNDRDACYKREGLLTLRGGPGARYRQMARDDLGSLTIILNSSISQPIHQFVRFNHLMRLFGLIRCYNITGIEALMASCGNSSLLIDVDMCDQHGWAPLHYVAALGNDTMAKWLIKRKVSLTTVIKSSNKNSLHLAAANGHWHIVRLLLQNAKQSNLLRYVDMRSKRGRTALHLAARAGRLNVCLCLLEYQATYCALDANNKTPLDLSSNSLVTQLFRYIQALFNMAYDGDDNIICQLQHLSADKLIAVANARDLDGHNLQMIAFSRQHFYLANQILRLVDKTKRRINFNKHFNTKKTLASVCLRFIEWLRSIFGH